MAEDKRPVADDAYFQGFRGMADVARLVYLYCQARGITTAPDLRNAAAELALTTGVPQELVEAAIEEFLARGGEELLAGEDRRD